MDKNKVVYVRIISLTNEESPIEYVEGITTGGSINLEGDSSVRRTCNLTFIAKNSTITDAYWGINTKFKLEIKDQVNDKWNSMGIYLVAGFNTSKNINSINI